MNMTAIELSRLAFDKTMLLPCQRVHACTHTVTVRLREPADAHRRRPEAWIDADRA